MPWKIDRYEFTTVDRQLEEAVPIDSELIRPGVDGTAFHVDAWRAPTQTLTATVILPRSQVRSFRDGCFKLQTTTVGLVDQHDDGWTVYVRRVVLQSFTQIDGQVLLRAAWTLVPQSERP